ncbi:MAG: hypothetical protein JWL60_1849 [Gemmatimonadetes bacterium]|jgi:hypothetical protein|nr:hypothetical protein [Gemmatimonadota bacterium]
MKSLRTEHDREAILARIGSLEASAAARWGRMKAPQMIAHLVQSLRMATGELPVRAKRTPLRYAPIKQLVMYVLPMPKGLPTAPELLQREPASWDAEVAALRGALQRFAERAPDAEWPAHPVFGPFTAREWGVQAHSHVDHHLRQFGA